MIDYCAKTLTNFSLCVEQLGGNLCICLIFKSIHDVDFYSDVLSDQELEAGNS